MEHKLWWKVAAAVILVYVFTVGMLMPLKPGIVQVSPSGVKTNETVTLQVTGYNSHFQQAEDSLRAWLKLSDELAMAPSKIEVKNDRQLSLQFNIPAYLPFDERIADMTLVLDNAIDGASNYPTALLVTQDSINPGLGTSTWTNTPIQNLHRHSGITFPYRNILVETIRNTYFHVSLWLAMMILFIAALVYSIRYLRDPRPEFDRKASAYTTIGTLYGILGLITGMIWAQYTWGIFWSGDPKQNMTAVALLIYLAYFVLRSVFPDQERGAKVSAVYNIFAFVALIPLIYVIPRLVDSLHPGAGGNITFGSQDLDNTMRMVFYPAVIGWALVGVWMATLRYRLDAVQDQLEEQAYEQG